MNTLILDLETTTKESARRTANPFDPENEIVCIAYKHSAEQEAKCVPWSLGALRGILYGVELVVAQNAKFDLLYLLQHAKDAQWFLPWLKQVKIYDTMVAEYLITGQQSKFASLNKLSEKYGGTLKDDRVKEFWEAGVSTKDIPQDILYEYAKHDILNTELVYLKQQKSINTLQMHNLINVNMDDLLSTTLIEFNGIKIDSQFANEKCEELGEPNYDDLKDALPKDIPFDFNWASNQHLGALLFGLGIKYTAKEEIGTFKTGPRKGEVKYKNTEKLYTFPGIVRNTSVKKRTESGNIKVDDETLLALLHQKGLAARVADRVLKERDKAKQINTYYRPLVDLSRIDGFLHAELVHVQTNTGRLSSRNPNIQNWSKGSESDIKACCVSRFEDGYIVEIDASQLEIVVQAYLTQDERMIAEIKKGTDFHCLRLANKTKLAYQTVYKLCKVDKDPEWDKKRTLTKAFSFQRAYGAGSKAIAASTGMNEDEVKALIASENELFPAVEEFNNRNIEEVQRNKKIIRKEDKLIGQGYMDSITGRRYVFEEQEAPDFLRKRGITHSFSPTQIKNYVVQGFGAEILAVFRAYLARKLIGKEDKVVIINTVHDSIIFDCSGLIIETFINWLKDESKKVVSLVEKAYNIHINVPLAFDIKHGKNWKDLK